MAHVGKRSTNDQPHHAGRDQQIDVVVLIAGILGVHIHYQGVTPVGLGRVIGRSRCVTAHFGRVQQLCSGDSTSQLNQQRAFAEPSSGGDCSLKGRGKRLWISKSQELPTSTNGWTKALRQSSERARTRAQWLLYSIPWSYQIPVSRMLERCNVQQVAANPREQPNLTLVQRHKRASPSNESTC